MSWQVILSVTGADGQRTRPVKSFARKRDADAWARRMESSRDDGAFVRPSRLTLGEYLTGSWLPARKTSLRASTFESYARNVRLHVLPHLGHVQLQALTPSRLDAWYAELLESGRGPGRGLSTTTVRYLHVIVHKALSDALRKGLVVRNVAEAADPPKASASQRVEMKTWTAEQLRAFLSHVRGDRLEAAFVLAATTGMRRGEVLGLRWADVDLDRPQLAVRQSLVAVAYRLELSAPKTARGQRVIPLDATTVAALRVHHRRQLEERMAWGEAYREDGAGLVFTREDGAPVHPDHLADRFERLVKATGLPRIRFHDLRHTAATLALAAGVPAEVISDRLGHARRSFTVDVYTHAVPAMAADAAERLAAAIFGEQ